MPPKPKGKGKGKGKDPMALMKEEMATVKSTMLAKELQLFSETQKTRTLEERSMYLCSTVETMSYEAETEISNLQDAIFHVTQERDVKEQKVMSLEEAYGALKVEKEAEVAALLQHIQKVKDGYDFKLADLQLQLNDARVELRDMHDFSIKRGAIEAEIAGLKEQVEREHKQHQEALSDAERMAVQEKERLKNEMARRVQETIDEMDRLTNQRLHDKTKKAMADNAQMVQELAYQVHATEVLLHKNGQLVQEIIQFERTCRLLREMADDLRRKNHTYQKAMRLMVYKLRKLQHSEEQLKRTIYESELEKEKMVREVETRHHHMAAGRRHSKLTEIIQENAKKAASVAEEAVKFLYACIEEVELERMAGHKPAGDEEVELPRSLCSLEDLSQPQRRAFLTTLLHTAIKLRALEAPVSPDDSHGDPSAAKNDQILDLDVDALGLQNASTLASTNKNPVSVGVQVESKELQPRHVRISNDHHQPSSAPLHDPSNASSAAAKSASHHIKQRASSRHH